MQLLPESEFILQLLDVLQSGERHEVVLNRQSMSFFFFNPFDTRLLRRRVVTFLFLCSVCLRCLETKLRYMQGRTNTGLTPRAFSSRSSSAIYDALFPDHDTVACLQPLLAKVTTAPLWTPASPSSQPALSHR